MSPYSNYGYVLSDVKMFKVNEIIIPNVMAHWKDLAYAMEYCIADVEGFDGNGRNLKERCNNLITNWLTTAHGPTPKTYQTLLKYIKKVDEFTAPSEEIEELIKGKDKLIELRSLYIAFIFLLQLYWMSKLYTYIILCYHALVICRILHYIIVAFLLCRIFLEKKFSFVVFVYVLYYIEIYITFYYM